MSHSTMRNLTPGSWEELVFDIYSGISVGVAHSLWMANDMLSSFIIRPVLLLLGLSQNKLVENGSDDKSSLKVVGVGYGRTGTYSLSLALGELGFPTLHTQHLYENPEILDMWTERVFFPSVRDKKVTMGKPDFDLIASKGYQGTMDLPMALYFEEIASDFPDCKFILTTRDNSDIWFRSWDALTKSIAQPARVGRILSNVHVQKLSYYFRWIYAIVNKDEVHLTAPDPIPNQNKRRAIESYEEHNHRVRKVIPADRLLEYSVRQGWQPLCDFLEIESCPKQSFPQSNSMRSVQIQSITSVIFSLAVIMFIVFSLFSFLFQKAMGKTVLRWASVKSKATITKLTTAKAEEIRKRNEMRFQRKETCKSK